MFTTPEYVKAITGYDVTAQQVSIAQGLIETLIGKVEAVIFDANDRAILGNAVAYQAVYMSTNTKVVFEQAAVTGITAGEAATSFDLLMHSPWYSPLAVKALNNLSWKRTRSVRVGKSLQRSYRRIWETS